MLESLTETVCVFSNDIAMEFGVKKCPVLTMKKGKMTSSDGKALPNETTMKGLKEGDSYMCLGTIQTGGTKHHQVKEKVKTKYFRRMREILETNLNDGNIMTGINRWTISLLRYSADFLDWTGAELEKMDKETKKLMTMHQVLNPKSDVASIYLSRREGKKEGQQ